MESGQESLAPASIPAPQFSAKRGNIMPSRVGNDLNKTISAHFTMDEILVGTFMPVVAYTVRVSQPKGLSLTGFEATMMYDVSSDVNDSSFIVIELLENFIFPNDQPSINHIFFPGPRGGDSIFFISDTLPKYTQSFNRVWTAAPIQLRYGTSYSLYVRASPNLTTIHAGISLFLSALGYENVDTDVPHIQLR